MKKIKKLIFNVIMACFNVLFYMIDVSCFRTFFEVERFYNKYTRHRNDVSGGTNQYSCTITG